MTLTRRIILILSTLLMTAVGLYTALVFPYFRDGSLYASNYSEKAFKKVIVGMNRGLVHSLLGRPLHTERVTPYDIWDYGEQVIAKRDGTKTEFSLGSLSKVWFDEEGVVIEAHGFDDSVIRTGMTKNEVRKILGAPPVGHSSRSVVIEYYTLPPELGRYEERAVGFDKNGKVSEIRKRSIHYD